MKRKPSFIVSIAVTIIISALCVALSFSYANLRITQSNNETLTLNNQMQSLIIAAQLLSIHQFNQVSKIVSTSNTSVDAKSEEKVIEYREILRIEKTCDFPVPDSISNGLLDYANRLRASALHSNSGRANNAGISSASSGKLTYCQAVLWIDKLLATVEKANNKLSGINEIENLRVEAGNLKAEKKTQRDE